MSSEVISFSHYVLAKDLEAYSQALFKQVQALQLQNAVLQSKLEHLEELLKNIDSVPTIK
jgi:predicted ArsR family transcriptional regulator